MNIVSVVCVVAEGTYLLFWLIQRADELAIQKVKKLRV